VLTEILNSIARWPAVTLVRTDPYAYATINAMHLVGIGLLVGAIVSSDLRTAGIWKRNLWREGLETCVPVAATGLALAVGTGAVLFSIRGGHYISDPAFLIKVLLVAAGLTNVFLCRRANAQMVGNSPSTI
jgi:hypothetical protein